MRQDRVFFARYGLSMKRVDKARVWDWLHAGLRDFQAAPAIGMIHGGLAALVGMVITWGLCTRHMYAMVLPLAAGLFMIAPLLAFGLYDTSARLARGEKPTVAGALTAWLRKPVQVGAMAVVLMLFHLFWVRVASLLYALFQGGVGAPPDLWSLADSLFSVDALPFVITGTLIGGALAATVFAISVMAIPMLLDRETDVVTAMTISVIATLHNPAALLIWAWLIVYFLGLGMLPGFLGLVITLPVLAHASWHAYRDIIEWEAAPASDGKES